MKKLFSITGYTLIELIVSLALLCLIVLGIFSINSVLNTNNQDYGQKYLVKSETQATLNHILNDASLAVGSGTSVGTPSELDTGILVGAAMGAADNNSFCIHQSPSGVDTWLCYTFTPATYQIAYCNKTYNLSDAAGFRGASGACTTAAQFLGSAFSITNPTAPVFTDSVATNQLQFSITIQNCLNNSLATCSATGTSTDPANNPEIQLTGSVTPSQEGM
jgi:prepilin-type N-terminal cleavage/methylation domain-containing protein